MEIQPLKRSDVQVFGTNFLVYGAIASKQLTKKEIVDPKLWVNVASKFVMGCEIRVVDVDNSFMARVFITFANQHDVRLHLLEYHVFETASVTTDEDEYTVRMRGPHKWCIMRKDDPDPVQSDIATKHEAEKQLTEYLNTLAR